MNVRDNGTEGEILMRVFTDFSGRFLSVVTLCCLLSLAAGCATGLPATSEPAPKPASNEYTVTGLADEMMAKAIEAEVWITPALVHLAGLNHGQMIGLEFRLKSLESTTRKIETRMAERDHESQRDVAIRDVLRYTMQFEDQPAGHYDQSVANVLDVMEGLGHTVVTVKNYWPRGDDYSGVNAILTAPDGFAWELQFHTPQSFKLKMDTHAIYEQVREPGFPVEQRRSLFIQVAEQWNLVPIPAGVLEQGSLHMHEKVIVQPSP